MNHDKETYRTPEAYRERCNALECENDDQLTAARAELSLKTQRIVELESAIASFHVPMDDKWVRALRALDTECSGEWPSFPSYMELTKGLELARAEIERLKGALKGLNEPAA
jgi:hypothetical protein